jgi:hypothetical protein
MGARLKPALVAILLIWLPSAPAPALAQGEAPVGVRAAGMGGAFTAVADDASAVFWNPGGLAGGAFFSVVLDGNRMDDRSATLIALGTPPLALSYYRTATGDLPNGRNTLVTHHAGVSVVQSLADRIAAGATLKLVRGDVSTGQGPSSSTNKFDADIGVMTKGALGRLGLSVRNLLQPEFRTATGVVRLDRRVRAGIALNVRQDTTVAADIDLTSAPTARGEWRDVALGLETRATRKTWLRTGVHWNAKGGEEGGAAPVGSIGGSYAVYGSTMADAQVTFGSSNGNRGWGVGLRFVF